MYKKEIGLKRLDGVLSFLLYSMCTGYSLSKTVTKFYTILESVFYYNTEIVILEYLLLYVYIYVSIKICRIKWNKSQIFRDNYYEDLKYTEKISETETNQLFDKDSSLYVK